jgi:hypothetical protein
MRNVRVLTILGLVTIVTLMMVISFGCTDTAKPKEAANTEVTEQATDTENPVEGSVTYECPIHFDQTSTDPNAVCPVCGTAMKPVNPAEKEELGYACPMHPDQKSTDPNALCPVCGMQLQPVKEAEDADVQTYACPMHPDQKSADINALCPICGMKLEPVKEAGDTAEGETGETTPGEGAPEGNAPEDAPPEAGE